MEMSEETGGLLPAAPRERIGFSPRQSRRQRNIVLVLLLLVGVAVALVVRSSVISVIHSLSSIDGLQFERHFATKTVYWDQRRHAPATGNRVLRALPPATLAEASSTNSVRLLQSQLVARHGIRYPTLKPIKDLQALLAKLSEFEDRVPQWLRDYALQYNESVEGELAVSGTDELRAYARRLLSSHGSSKRKATYSEQQFEISHTYVSRTKASAIAFVSEYFENPDDVHLIEHPKTNDTILRFYDVCERYLVEVKQNKSAVREMREFAKSTAMASATQQLTAALGLDPLIVPLTVKDVAAAFSACAFDIALYSIRDQWCSLFDTEMVHSLDYYDDLKTFYQLAGGYPINYEMASVLLQDIVHEIERRASGSSSKIGVYRFAHAETTLPLMTLLGFSDKTPLLSSASLTEIDSRGFRTSTLAPFAANIEFRLYESLTEGHLVQVLVNERDDVVIRGCSAVLCPFDTLKRLWRPYLEYDFESRCQVP